MDRGDSPEINITLVVAPFTHKFSGLHALAMHSWKTFALVSLPAIIQTVLAQNVVDLSGDGWTVSSKALNISVPGRLPSQAHLDLYAAKVIGRFPSLELDCQQRY